jgi:hypothetical protein
MSSLPPLAVPLVLALAVAACSGSPARTASVAATSSEATPYLATPAEQPGVAARTPQASQELAPVRLERVSTMIPWPRGIAFVGDELAIVARGRHRNYGGPAPDVQDREATIFLVDPDVREPFVAGQPAGAAVAANGRVLAEPDPAVVHLYDRARAPLDNWLMNRPFCTMKYDRLSENLIFCAFSGVDIPGEGGATFRKNATDAIFRYDLRSQAWGIIERHRPEVVPHAEQAAWISNAYYPHHDPAHNAPPHGLLNGPNGCQVAGRWLYAVGKDNHALARYDLAAIRRDPEAPAPPGELVLGEHVDLCLDGEVRRITMHGHSAVAAHAGHLYVASRTSSLVVRFPIDADGDLVRPIVGELIAEFEPYSAETSRSADLWEMIASPEGDLVVSMSRDGLVWRFRPDPAVPFDGNNRRPDAPTPNKPWIDIRALTQNPKANISNMAFASDGSLYFCMTMPEPNRELAGNVMRASTGG